MAFEPVKESDFDFQPVEASDFAPITPKSQPPMNPWQKFRQGVRTGLQGMALGGKQALAEAGERIGLVSPETVSELREQEGARRQMSEWAKTQGGGTPGFSNPASWGEGLTEYGLPMLLPGGQARNVLQAMKGGAILGGLTGYTAPRTGEESRGLHTLGGAAGGAAGAGLVKGGIQAVKAIPKVAGKAVENVESRMAGTYAAEQGKKAVNSALQRVMPRPPHPGGKYTGAMKAAEDAGEVRAVEFLHRPENADVLPSIEGAKVAPKDLNAVTQFEAVENGITKLLKEQDRIIKEAGGEGVTFDKNKLVDFWINEAKKAENLMEGGGIVNTARKKIAALKGVSPGEIQKMSWDELRALPDVRGKYALEDALNDLTVLNTELRSGTVPIAQSVKGVVGREADLRRKLLDEMLTKNSDARFADLRKDMGALISLRDRNGKLLAKMEKSPQQQGTIMGDYALSQIAYGLAAGKLAPVAKGIAIGAKKLYGRAKSEPNAIVEHMHRKFAEGYRPKIKSQMPYPSPEAGPKQLTGKPYIDAEFSEVPPSPAGMPAPPKQLPAPTRQLPQSTAMPTGQTPGSTFSGRPVQAPQGMSAAEIEASRRKIDGRLSQKVEEATTPRDKRLWKGVQSFVNQFNRSPEEAARLLDMMEGMSIDEIESIINSLRRR